MNKTAALFLETVSKYNSIVIYIPGSPDPDAIASAYAIKMILKYISIDSDIFAEKKLSLPQNRAFTRKLKIPVFFGKAINLKKYQGYIVPDYQNNIVEQIGSSLPCVAHIDHHDKSSDSAKADFSLIRTDAGSTSTLVALIVKNINIHFSEKDLVSMATALTFGIQTDTDKYSNITPLDFEALNYLSGFADRNLLADISSIPLSPETLLYYNKAKNIEIVYRDWAFYGIGYVDAKNRDSIAITADLIIKNSEYKTVAVFAIIENHKKRETYLDVVLRTKSGNIDLNRIIKTITPSGGGRRFKGAYQVKLNYLKNVPDKDLLWQVVEAATLETLRRSRDAFYVPGIKSLYGNLKNKVYSFVKKENGFS
jgi:nanoRNase/pAp phosphatase (c-di-AMP/oligoRNAs hydrolase)